MPSFQDALNHGVTIEMDVDWTADDVPVLLHDATVDRTTDGTGPVVPDLRTALDAAHDAERRAIVELRPGITRRQLLDALPPARILPYGRILLIRWTSLTAAAMARWRSAGITVWAWTADHRAYWRELAELHVDAVLTNRTGRYEHWQAAGCP